MNETQIIEEIKNALNINKTDELKQYSKDIIQSVRRSLCKPTAFNKSILYTYRKKGQVPSSLQEGFALGVIIEKGLSKKKELNSYHDISFKQNFEYVGLYFDETKITTKLKRSKNNNNKFDAEVTITLEGVHLLSPINSNYYNLRFLSDSQSALDVVDNIKVSGKGVQLCKVDSKECLQSFNSNGQFSHTKIATEHELLFTKEVNNETKIIITRNMRNSFFVKQLHSKSLVEQATFAIRRPTRKLTMEIIFDKEHFSSSNPFNISPIATPGYLATNHTISESTKINQTLDGEEIKLINNNTWRWTSKVPPITGMKYGFQYTIEEIEKCLI